MTKYAKLVIMTKSYDDVVALLEQFGAAEDDSPQGRKRFRILEAATALFVHHGYRKTSVDDVARDAGVAKGTVYLYFRNKSDLLIHAIVEEKKRYLKEMLPVFDRSASAAERLRRWVRITITVSRRMPLISRLIGGDNELSIILDDMNPGDVEERKRFETEFVADLIDEAAAPHDWTEAELETRARVLVNVLFAAITNDRLLNDDLSISDYAEQVATIIVDGAISTRSETGHAAA